MLWPVREGAGTRYLHESELSEFYGDRFRGSTVRVERLASAVTDSTALIRVDRQAGVWVTVDLVPELPGDPPRGVEGIQRLLEIVAGWVDVAWPQGILCGELATRKQGSYAVRVRRVVYNPDAMNNRLAQNAYLECYDDSSVVASVPLSVKQPPKQGTARLAPEWLEALVLELLHFVTFYARTVRSSGNAYVHVELRHPAGNRIRLAENDIQWRTNDVEELGVSIDVEDLVLPDISVTLDVLDRFSTLARVAYLVMRDLVSEFGIPHVRLLNPDGTISPSARLTGIQEWAVRNGSNVYRAFRRRFGFGR